jgi:hypothetical protein
VAGSAGVGKTFIKGKVFSNKTCPADLVCEFDIKELFSEWQKQQTVVPRPDLHADDIVLNQLPTLAHHDKPCVADFLASKGAAFYAIDSLDEIHPDNYTWVLEQIEEFAFRPEHKFVHVVVFGRPLAFRDYWQHKYWRDARNKNGDIALFMLKPPTFRTTGDLLVSSWNYHSWKYKVKWAPGGGEPTMMSLDAYTDWIANGFSRSLRFASVSLVPNENTSSHVHRTLLDWATQHRVVCGTLYNMAGNSMIREIAESHALNGLAYDERAVMDAYLHAWLERDTKSDDRPSAAKPKHLELYLQLLERVAVKYLQEDRLDGEGFFPVEEDDVIVTEYEGKELQFPVRRILERSGLMYMDPRDPGTPRYRFEPIWFHRLLVEKHNERQQRPHSSVVTAAGM